MIRNLKLYGILGVIIIAIGLFVARFLNNHSFVSDDFIQAKADSIKVEQKKVKTLDSTLFSITQDFDILKSNDKKYQIVIEGLTAENKRLRNVENTCCEELKHAEETGGIIRYNWLGKVKKKK